MSGMVGPFMTPLARSPLALIRRKPVRKVSGVCPKCGRGMAEERAMRSGAVAVSTESCCSSCKKGGPCDGDKKKRKKRLSELAVPNCTPLTPPDPDCTLTRGWKEEMQRRLNKAKKRSPRRRL
jgi:hypothetical protein